MDTQTVHLLNGIACAYWAVFIGFALRAGRINLGSLVPKVVRATNPRAFWGLIAFLCLIVLWTAAAAIFQKGVVDVCRPGDSVICLSNFHFG